MPAFINLIGKRFGRLVSLGYDGSGRERLRCDCGVEKSLPRAALYGNTTSCGCAHREELIARNTKHGHTPRGARTSVYARWAAMIQRCTDPNDKRYADWGGRGISVCERWHNFENFLADMGEPPPGLVLDRIDNNGNYEPGNCRWVTASESRINSRPRSPYHTR